MPSDVTRDEFKQVVTRLDVVEREVEGEKMVTRHILEQTRLNAGDLAELRVEVKGMRGELTELRGKFDGLVENLPRIVGDAVRDANRDHDKR